MLHASADLHPALVDAGLLEDRPAAQLDAAQPSPYEGRGRPHLLQLPGVPPLVVKSLRHGGLLAFLGKDRYWSPRRLLQAAALIQDLERAGVPTAPFAFARIRRCPPFCRLELATQQIPSANTLQAVLEQSPPASWLRQLAPQVGRLIRRLHDHGVQHADLNLKNLLVAEDPPVSVIDFEGSRRHSSLGTAGRVANFERLFRSLAKNRLHGQPVQDVHLARLLRAYEPQSWRELLRESRAAYRRTEWLHGISWLLQRRSRAAPAGARSAVGTSGTVSSR